MKKHGFTLAELLIVLGIAGVVAAVILPAINGLMPDKTKINYLKVYDELGKNIKALTSDSSIFPVLLKEGSTDIDVSRYPLVNNSQPLKAPFKDDTKYSGDKKLCNLLAHTFGADSCNTTSYPDKSSFTTPNGMEWWISQTKREIDTAENKISYQTDIYVDVDSSKESSNCMYGEENCKQPDRFKFLLAADGRLVPADPVGVHYINTRKNLLKKKFDVEGEELASLEDGLLNNNYLVPGDKNNLPITPETPNNSNDETTTQPSLPEEETDEQEDTGNYCERSFKNSQLGQLNLMCLGNAKSTITYDQPSPNETFAAYKERFRNTIGHDRLYNSFLFYPGIYHGSGLILPTTSDITIYYDFYSACFTSTNPLNTTCYINNKYKNKHYSDIYKAGTTIDNTIYVTDWEKPFAYQIMSKNCTLFNGGADYCQNSLKTLSLIYDPFTSIPSKYDSWYINGGGYIQITILYADTQPRYDDNNIYLVIDGAVPSPTIEYVSAWILNKNENEVANSNFVKNSSFAKKMEGTWTPNGIVRK